MADEHLVLVRKRYGRRRLLTGVQPGWWSMSPSLDAVTRNWASREGWWLLTFIGPEHRRGRHERVDGVEENS